MGEDAALVIFHDIEDKVVKTNLLAEQATNVHCQLSEVLKLLEAEASDQINGPVQSASNIHADHKEVHKRLIRVFNNFSFIKNVFEIDCEDFVLEYRCFTLKDSLIYCINFLMSDYPESKINVTLDP